jgi:hypothetical protein
MLSVTFKMLKEFIAFQQCFSKVIVNKNVKFFHFRGLRVMPLSIKAKRSLKRRFFYWFVFKLVKKKTSIKVNFGMLSPALLTSTMKNENKSQHNLFSFPFSKNKISIFISVYNNKTHNICISANFRYVNCYSLK